MKKLIVTLAAGLIVLSSCNKMGKSVNLKTETDSASYAMGVFYGDKFKQIKNEMPDINYDLLVAGLASAIKEEKTLIEVKNCEPILMEFSKKQYAKMLEKNTKDSQHYIDSVKTKAGIIVQPSGLIYEVVTEGTGVSPISIEDTVVVHYKGTFPDGKVFDSSLDRGAPWESPLTTTIPAWQELLPLMKVGSKVKAYVPANLGYGERMMNKLMIFEIELLGVKPAKAVKGKK